MSIRILDLDILENMLDTLIRISMEEGFTETELARCRYVRDQIIKTTYIVKDIVEVVTRKYIYVPLPSKGIEIITTPQYAVSHFTLTGRIAGIYLPHEDKIALFLFNIDNLVTTLIHEYLHYIFHRYIPFNEILTEICQELATYLSHKYKVNRDRIMFELLANSSLLEEMIVNLMEVEYFNRARYSAAYYSYFIPLINTLRRVVPSVDYCDTYNIVMERVWDTILNKVNRLIRPIIVKPLSGIDTRDIYYTLYLHYIDAISGSFRYNWCDDLLRRLIPLPILLQYLKMINQ